MSGARDITISATQKETLTTTAEGGAGPASVAINPNVAIVIANLSTKASIGRGAAIGGTSATPGTGTSGKIDAKADQSVTATTTAKGAVTAGSGTDVGIALSLGLAIIDASSDSSSMRSLHAAGPISFQADGDVSSTIDAEASAKGAKKDGETTNDKADKNLTDAKSKQTTNTGKSTSKSETPKSSTADGTSVERRGRGRDQHRHDEPRRRRCATARPSAPTPAPLTLKTSANTDAVAKARATPPSTRASGVGAGIAINSVDVTNRASTGDATIGATGLDVEATMRNVSGNTQHLVSAEAYAGASKASDVGIAGALALNIVVHHTEAVVGAGANVALTGGALTLNAVSDEKDVAKASGKESGGGSSVGVGAAVALNILIPTVVRAEAESGADLSLTTGTTITVTALGTRVVETSVEAGTSGGTAVTPAVALVLMKDDAVTARLSSSSSVTASGAAMITATHGLDVSKTTAQAEAAGSSVAVGADIALNIVLDWSTTAELDADLTASSVAVTATSTTNSAAEAKASAKGSESSDNDADKKKQDQVDNNPNTSSKGVGTLPKAKDGDGTHGGTDAGNAKTGSEGGDQNSGSVGVAAAISLNWVVTTNSASIAQGAHVTGTSGLVAVSAQNSTDATAKATGLSYSVDGTHVAAAVGVNFADVQNNARIGMDAVVTGAGVTVEAVNTSDAENDFVVWGLAAAGGASQENGGASVAASIGVEVVFFHTEASVAKGAHVTAKTGKVDVVAKNKLGLQNLALSGGGSAGGAAVGGAIAVNVFPDITTEAFVDSDNATHITQVDALQGITVSATSSLKEAPAPTVPLITLPPLSSVALAGGASTGGAAVSGSVIVDVLFLTTKAYIANGARVNQHPERLTGSAGAAQTVMVKAKDDTSITNLAGGLNFTTSGAGVGVGIDVDVVEKTVQAWIAGPDTVVSAAGDITVSAESTENFHELAVDFGVSTSNAAVDGSIIVVVFPGVDPLAKAEVGGTVHAGGAFGITASDTFTTLLLAGGGAISGSSAGVAVSVVVIDRQSTVDAGVDAGANLQANGGTGLTVSATQHEEMTLIAVGGAGGDSAAVAGSAIVDILTNTTLAHVDSGVTVGGSTTGVAVSASDTTEILALAGTIGIGGTAGVGVGVDVEVVNKDTEASIGSGGSITASGNVTVGATSSEEITSISVGGGFGGTASVNVQAAVPVINVTTMAFVADGSSGPDGAVVSTGGSVGVTADERLDMNVIAGNISGGGTAAVGAAVSVPVVTKETHAYIGDYAKVDAAGNGTALTVATGSYTVATEDTRFDPATDISGGDTIDIHYTGNLHDGDEVRYDAGGGTPVTGLTDGALYYVDVLGDGKSVKLYSDHALSTAVTGLSGGSGENHRLFPTNQAAPTKDASPRFNPAADVNYGTDTFNLPYDPGVSDGDQVVYSAGGGTPIGGLVDGGEYYVGDKSGNSLRLYTKDQTTGALTLVNVGDPGPNAGRSHSIVGAGNTPSGDASAMGPRVVTKQTDSFRGVAVTANNSDDIGGFGISFGFAGTAAVNLAGVVNVENIHTSAHIGDSAEVNCGATCASNVASPNAAQSVRVAAANQYYELEVAASLSIGGSAGVAVPITVRVVNIDTYAYIGSGATVNAKRDISVTANGQESIIGVTAGAGGGTVGVAGTVAVTVANVHTYACTGTPTAPAYKCATGGATLNADNNVLVSANDTSKFVLITVAVAGGFVGVGLAVGVAVLSKETEAYLGAGSIVNAKALGASPIANAIPDGTFDTASQRYSMHGSFSGLAVVSSSSEDVFGLAPAVAGGFVGVARRRRRDLHGRDDDRVRRAGLAGQPHRAAAAASPSTSRPSTTSSRSRSRAAPPAASSVWPAGSTSASPTRARRRTSARARTSMRRPTSRSTGSRARRSRPTRSAPLAASSASPSPSPSGRSARRPTATTRTRTARRWATGRRASTTTPATSSPTRSNSKTYVARCDITPGESWDSGNDYNACRVIEYGGKLYQANTDVSSGGSAPSSSSNWTTTAARPPRWRRTPTRRAGSRRPTRSTRRATRASRTTTRAPRAASTARTWPPPATRTRAAPRRPGSRVARTPRATT